MSNSTFLRVVLALVILGLCGVLATAAYVLLARPGDALPSAAPQPAPTPTAAGAAPTSPPPGAVSMGAATKRRLKVHFTDKYGFTWSERGDLLSGKPLDGKQKLNVWEGRSGKLSEVAYSFHFRHAVRDLPNRATDADYQTGVWGTLETLSIILPFWSEGPEWARAGLTELPPPNSRDVTLQTEVEGAPISLETGDYSDTEYVVIFSVRSGK